MRNTIISFLQTKNIEIPDNDNEIINLFLGAVIVGKIDYWLERAFNYMDYAQPQTPYEREWSEAAQKDNAYRACFGQMNNETKRQIKNLLQESVEGVVFSMLSEFDKNWIIALDSKAIKGVAGEDGELHTDLYNWLDLFGRNKATNHEGEKENTSQKL